MRTDWGRYDQSEWRPVGPASTGGEQPERSRTLSLRPRRAGPVVELRESIVQAGEQNHPSAASNPCLNGLFPLVAPVCSSWFKLV